jgi:hypothetical protein
MIAGKPPDARSTVSRSLTFTLTAVVLISGAVLGALGGTVWHLLTRLDDFLSVFSGGPAFHAGTKRDWILAALKGAMFGSLPGFFLLVIRIVVSSTRWHSSPELLPYPPEAPDDFAQGNGR